MKKELSCGFVPSHARWISKGLREHEDIPVRFLKMHNFLLSRTLPGNGKNYLK